MGVFENNYKILFLFLCIFIAVRPRPSLFKLGRLFKLRQIVWQNKAKSFKKRIKYILKNYCGTFNNQQYSEKWKLQSNKIRNTLLYQIHFFSFFSVPMKTISMNRPKLIFGKGRQILDKFNIFFVFIASFSFPFSVRDFFCLLFALFGFFCNLGQRKSQLKFK